MQAYSYRDDPNVPAFPDDQPLLVFDGLCIHCSDWVKRGLNSDRRGRFRMTVTQSVLGRALYRHYGLDEGGDNSLLLVRDGKVYRRSDAVIRICETVGGLWGLASLFRLVPRFLRDPVHDWVALNRYHWFGQRKTPFRPKPAWVDRFLA